MEFPVKTGAPARHRTECAILPVFDDGQLRGATKDFDRASRGAIAKLVRSGDAPSRLGTCTMVHRTQGTAAARWLLVGCSKHGDFSAKRLTGSSPSNGRNRKPSRQSAWQQSAK